MLRKSVLLAGLAALLAASPAQAASVLFSGSRTNADAPGAAAARCGMRSTANIRHDPPVATSVGTSNFGSFTPTLSHCIALPLSAMSPNPFDLGEFVFAFANGTITGTYEGVVTFAAPGAFDIVQTHIVTGGTGFFAGTTGSFKSAGQLTFPMGRPTVTQQFAGTLNIPAVPEPGTWGLMILGFGLIGGALRSRRRPANGFAPA